ncbi:MAG: FAD-binding domain-containing protein [Geminicoccaceae bacterium]
MHLVWFKRDLRTHDHAALAEAAARGPVLPLYVVEPAYWALPDSAPRQFAFVRACLSELRAELAALGQPLIVRHGEVIAVFEALRAIVRFDALWSHQETGNGWTYARDRRVAAWCRAHGIPWYEPRQHGVIRRLQSRRGWAGKWQRQMAAPQRAAPALAPLADVEPGPIPTAAELGLGADPCPGVWPGGRQAGEAVLHGFLHTRGQRYRQEMASPRTAYDACSRLSPHLAWGSLSLREVYQAAQARKLALKGQPGEDAKAWRASLSSFTSRLHWHCHFMQKLEDEPRIEHSNFHRLFDSVRTEAAPATLAAWRQGETGFPLIDACMRALDHTGWLNFRMRAMVMSFASYHLWQPWQASGRVLARLFVDYEPGIHWSQCQMQSGTTGINTLRVYNPTKQARDQDPDGTFIKQWLPDLADVPKSYIHQPFSWPKAAERLDGRYPRPIVDQQQAARAAKERLYALRRDPAFRAAAEAIQDRHGSRKAGIAQVLEQREIARRRAKADPRQLDLLPEG